MTKSKSKPYKAREVNGVLLLNKPLNFSSNQILQKIRHLFQAKKAGHTGSLDPLASGMLPICFGEATKFSQFLLDSDKCYFTKAKLGIATSTGDAEGEVIDTQKIPENLEEKISDVLEKFTGEVEQIPPMYSALKHQGVPLYKLARQGKQVERKTRKINIRELKLLELTKESFSLNVVCSKGTYIRTLVEDIAKALGTVAHVQVLHRKWVNPFEKKMMYSFEQLQQDDSLVDLDKFLLPIDCMLQHFSVLQLDDVQTKSLQNGQQVLDIAVTEGLIYRLYNKRNQFIGLGQSPQNNILTVKRLLKV